MTTPPFGQPPSGGPGQPPPPPGYGPPAGHGQPAPPPGYGPPAGHGQQIPQYAQGMGQPGQWGQAPMPPAPQRSGATKWIAFGAAGLLTVGLMGGGAVFAFSKFNGSGPQPETAVAASAIAFAKVDLDPSASQKVDAFRFASKFPGAQDPLSGMDEDGDLRKQIVEGVQKEGGLDGVDYEQDIEPWIGHRVGVAVLPSEGDAEPGVVIALASTDDDAAEEGLAKATRDGGYCSVQADFAICGEEQAVVDKAVNDAATASLADSDTFSQDMDDLGEDGLVTGWMDASAMGDLTESMAMGGGLDEAPTTEGRYAVALRFDGPTLELAGRMNGLPDGSVPAGDGTSIGDLPADTLGALAVTGLDESLTQAWSTIDTSLGDALGSTWQQGLDDFTAQTGISVPDDITKAVGDDTVIAMGPDASTPKIALRTNGDRATIDKLVGVLDGGPSSAAPQLTVKDGGDDRTVVASDAGYADQVASDGGLGDSDAFKDAVPDAGQAGTVGYVDVRQAVELFGDEMSQEDRENVESLSAVGFSVWGEDDHADFRLRLTTK